LIAVADQPVRTLESNLRAGKADEVRRCRADVIYIEADIKAKKANLLKLLKAGDSDADLPQEIAQLEAELGALQKKAREPVLVADDFTAEAIAGIMDDNEERAVVTSGDTCVFNVERYGDNPSIELLLKSWEGSPHREARKSKDRECADLKRPCLAMFVATQVENVKALAAKNPSLVHRGLLPRFLPVIPEDNIGTRDISALMRQGGVPHAAQAAFNEPLINLAHHIAAQPDGIVRLEYTDAATLAYEQHWQGYEERIGPAGDLLPFREAGSKLPVQLQKLTSLNWAIRASLGDPTDRSISADMVHCGAAQLEHFIPHSVALYDAITISPEEALAARVREWCTFHRGEAVTRRSLRQSTARRYPRELFLRALEILVDEGTVKVTEDRETGGRPTQEVVII
jgi:hypothetical protein